ncbi:MAG: PAS domain S-box protein [Isosphaeraceae bacterium]
MTTDLHWAEANLRGLLAAIVESSDDAIISKTLAGVITSWNRGAQRIFGYSAEEVVGKHISLLMPPERIEDLTRILESVRCGDTVDHYETKRRTKDDRIIDVSLTVSPIRDADGNIIGALKVARDITEQKRAAMERKEAEFRNVLESAPDAIVIIDGQGHIVRLNRQTEEIFDYTREELLGEPVEILVPERFRERHQKHRAAYSPQSRPRPMGMGLELYGRRKDGGEFPVDITLSPIESTDGSLTISVIRDITWRRRIEEQLLKLSRAVEQSADLVIITDTQGRIEYVNPKFTQVTGYTPDEAIGQDPRILKSGKTSPEEYRRLWETITSGREWRGEFLNKRKDGALYWASASISPLRNHQGVITHFVAIQEDISELKRAEEAQRASERRYRQFTEATLDALVVADERGVITLFNAAAERTFGYSEPEVLGQPLTILMPAEYHEAHQRGLRRYLETKEAQVVGRTIELNGRRKDGQVFPLELSLSAVELPEGICFLGAIRDLTERQRLQARVVQMEKLASLGLLSAGVAHEINNPLAYVANNLVVLERGIHGLIALVAVYEAAQAILESARPDLAAQVAHLAEEIDLPYLKAHIEQIVGSTRQGVKRVADIVQNLRGFARLDQAAVERANLHDAITSSLEMIRGRMDRHHIVVEQQFGDLPLVLCAPAQVNQVFLNLLVNALQAIEATSKLGGRIQIRTRAVGDEVIAEVADDGCGIPADVLPRIFDPFFTTKPVGEGTGLGLSISHGIVVDHGGRIEVESMPGQGTRFRVILPVRGKGRGR